MFKNELCYFKTCLWAPHIILAGALVPAGTVLETPDIEGAQVKVVELIRWDQLGRQVNGKIRSGP